VTFAAEDGPVGTVAMDYLSPKSLRTVRLRGRERVVELDLLGPSEQRWAGGKESSRAWEFERNDMFLGLMGDFMALAEGRAVSDNLLLPRLDRVRGSAELIAAAWEARAFHGVIEGGFA